MVWGTQFFIDGQLVCIAVHLQGFVFQGQLDVQIQILCLFARLIHGVVQKICFRGRDIQLLLGPWVRFFDMWWMVGHSVHTYIFMSQGHLVTTFG